MAARDYLIAYGYKLGGDGKYRIPGKRTQIWQELEGGKGWLRFEPGEQGQDIPEPFQVNSNYQGTSGLSKLHHPGAFDWVYPEEYVENIYRVAVETVAEQLHKARERKGQLADAAAPISAVPAITVAQLASMQNAQAGQAAAANEAEKKPEHKKHWWE